MTRDEVDAFLRREFPQLDADGPVYDLEAVADRGARMRLRVSERHLRPGGTVSGPAMMALADVAIYAALLGAVGPVALAVTTSLTFNFLRRPAAADILCTARLLRIGRRLAFAEASLAGADGPDLLCHATGTYALPG